MSKRLLEGDALMRRAADLGVSIASGEMINVGGKGMASIPAHEHEIQRRVLEAERHGLRSPSTVRCKRIDEREHE
jgi:hypothetical protein